MEAGGKAEAMARLLERERPAAVVALGDDVSDADAFVGPAGGARRRAAWTGSPWRSTVRTGCRTRSATTPTCTSRRPTRRPACWPRSPGSSGRTVTPGEPASIGACPTPTPPPSYRAVFAVPQLGRVVASMQLARIAQTMFGVAIVLFALAQYDSPSLAGHRHVRLDLPRPADRADRRRPAGPSRPGPAHGVRLRRGVRQPRPHRRAVAGGPAAGRVLVLIVIVTSLTSILSIVGLRTIIPLMVPSYLWERANAIDANGYVVATILGPPIAASLVAFLGAPEAIDRDRHPVRLAARGAHRPP